ncbi:hypothetical protein CCACVL1_06084 [Corchorus capsularis]|uniref:TF-B3 domain-containing protein n=1 Tax=Corchorus capsularis TaxID=210143 RepID=A0A1R3JHC6_COCAP|nr:hypothetical protein CCACVL1_06084 [Corchorus capsularis]
MTSAARPIKFKLILSRLDIQSRAVLNPGETFLKRAGLDRPQSCTFCLKGKSTDNYVELENYGNNLQFRGDWDIVARNSRFKAGDRCSFLFRGRDSEGVVTILVNMTPRWKLPSPDQKRQVSVLREAKWQEPGKEKTTIRYITSVIV